jgi:2-oxoglutarate ferredoxin oxidoreductase subunit alpha
VERLLRKHKASANFVPPAFIHKKEGSRIGIVTIGGCDPAVREAIELLPQRGIDADFMRIRGFPFPAEVEEFLHAHDVNFIVEQNRDAQLRSLLVLETGVPKDKLRSVLAFGGFPLSAKNVIDGIVQQWGNL